jgi:hypothetical protein
MQCQNNTELAVPFSRKECPRPRQQRPLKHWRLDAKYEGCGGVSVSILASEAAASRSETRGDSDENRAAIVRKRP